MKPPTRYPAMTMWEAMSGIASLKITPMGSTWETLPEESSVTPPGEFIHAFAATTDKLPKMTAKAMATQFQKWAHAYTRRHPKM